MPTKKRRVGFIPKSEVLDLISKLSIESNLSISKIVNILVEEALYKRGIHNKINGNVLKFEDSISFNNQNGIKINNDDKNFSSKFNNYKNNTSQYVKESSYELIDKEIYAKFLIFLQFQEKMKKNN